MAREVSSKILDGINDLVILAPIKDGFINAFDNITYATRLRIVSQALNDIRATAREYEKPSPFSDASERILSLLDFRIGVLDQDLFHLEQHGLKARRYMFLIATFDGVWEPYMRLIWRPLGPLLDLLLCNCERYVRATENSCEDYLAWIRSAQIDSAVFFTTTGVTVGDQIYLRKMEILQREGKSDLDLTQMAMPDPAVEAAKVRNADPRRANRLALEALGVLYRISDFYPPLADLYKQGVGNYEREDHLLLQAAHTILDGWNYKPLLDAPKLEEIFGNDRLTGEALKQFVAGFQLRFGKMLAWFDKGQRPPTGLPEGYKDEDLDRSEIQSGILTPHGSKERPATHGALLLMTVTNGQEASGFIKALGINFENRNVFPQDSLYRSIGFTKSGLQRLGVDRDVVRQFPKPFREGMAARASAIGDVWDNHPGNWRLPERNWPPVENGPVYRPGVAMSEVDMVVQLRCAPEEGENGAKMIMDEIKRIATKAEKSGAVLIHFEIMENEYQFDGSGKPVFKDHFGFVDGISQPVLPGNTKHVSAPERDQAMLGDVLCGYHTSLEDVPPKDPEFAQELQQNGSYLVIRKLKQNVKAYHNFVETEKAKLPGGNGDLLEAKLLGRYPDGRPLIAPASGNPNDFDYAGDPHGKACPFASHVRRANPRAGSFGRPPARLLRRGMSYGPRYQDDDGAHDRGLMFMAYNANIADQFEVIQRWINGGNSTGVASGSNDPLIGVPPRPAGPRTYRFEEGGEIIRVTMPESFVELQWGLYLFMPSKSALEKICEGKRPYYVMDEAREKVGNTILDRLKKLPDETARHEWKRLIEDLDAKDPAERDLAPQLYSAIRWYKDGSYRLRGGLKSGKDWTSLKNIDALKELLGEKLVGNAISLEAAENLAESWDGIDPDTRPVTIVASARDILGVLKDHQTFSSEEQLCRLEKGCGPIYVSQQPDDVYDTPRPNLNYKNESAVTNAIMCGQSEEDGYKDGFAAASAVLRRLIGATDLYGDSVGQSQDQRFFKLEVRREFLAPALAELCRIWFGLPDGVFMTAGHWDWLPVAQRKDKEVLCPGDFNSPSRHAFYPKPGKVVENLALDHGQAIRDASLNYVKACLKTSTIDGRLARAMFDHIKDPELLARNLIGMIIGSVLPMEGNLRGVLYEWLSDQTLWRHQAALRRATKDGRAAQFDAAWAALELPLSQAMCKRPSPDLLFRQARRDYKFCGDDSVKDGEAKDMVILSLVSATQRAIADPGKSDNALQSQIDQKTIDAVPIIFGGDRWKEGHAAHACPGRKLAMGAMTGMLAALLDVGRIEAQPAGLILKISKWPRVG
jgi:Dyp-type peroxidase family